MPLLIMPVGIPGSGKSTWVRQFIYYNKEAPYIVISSDDYVEQKAHEEGKTYTEVWSKYCKDAEQATLKQAKFAINTNLNVIWDQTNTSKKVRQKRLVLFPEHYSKYYVYFPTPEPEELKRRLATRPDKFIPEHVIEEMINRLEPPSIDEGFHGVISV